MLKIHLSAHSVAGDILCEQTVITDVLSALLAFA